MQAHELFGPEYMAETAEIGGVQFRFETLLAVEAKRVFNRLRPGLGEALVTLPLGIFTRVDELTPQEKATAALLLWAKIPAETVELAELLLYPHIYWKRGADAPGESQLSGTQELVFGFLSMRQAEEVLVRSFALNFSQYCVDFLSSLSSLGTSTPPKAQTSTPSSPPPLPPDASP